jgi:hypothetical protein
LIKGREGPRYCKCVSRAGWWVGVQGWGEIYQVAVMWRKAVFGVGLGCRSSQQGL